MVITHCHDKSSMKISSSPKFCSPDEFKLWWRQNKSSMKIQNFIIATIFCHDIWQLIATINLQWKFITGKICYHGDKSSIKIHHCHNFVIMMKIMVTTHRHDKSSMKIHHRQHFLPCQYIMATNRRNKWLPWQIIAITTRHHDNRSHYARI